MWLWLGCAALIAALEVRTAQARPSGEASSSGSDVVDGAEIEESIRNVEKRVRKIREVRDRGGPTRPAEVVESIRGTVDAETLFRWVRDEVEFEPYRGALRSPREVLSLRAANGADQARLLAALYDEVGVKYRYAVGGIGDVAAVEVLQEFAGRWEASERAEGVRTERPVFAADEFVKLLDEHVWLQVGDSKRQPADPATSEVFGQTRAKAEIVGKRLPSHLRSRLRATVVASFAEGPDEELMTVAGPLDELAYRPLSISFERSRVRNNAVVPRLDVGEQSHTGDRFLPGELETLHVRYDLVYGSREAQFRRSLFDRGESSGDAFRHRSVTASVLVVPGWASSARAAQTAERHLGSAIDEIKGRLEHVRSGELPVGRATVDSIVSAVGEAAALGYLLRVDAATEWAAEAIGVRPVLAQPRIVQSVAAHGEDGIAVEVERAGGEMTVVPRAGMRARAAEGFRSLRGGAVDRVRSEFLERVTDRSTVGMRELMRSAGAQKIPLVTIHSNNISYVDRLEVAERTRRRVRETVGKAGRVALAPSRPVEVDGVHKFGWWSLDPNTGDLRGHIAQKRAGFFGRAGGARGAVTGDSLERVVRSLYGSLEGQSAGGESVCDAMEQIRSVGRSLCAGGERRPLPEPSTCSAAGSASEGGATGIGVVALGSESCTDRVSEARCGVSLVQRVVTTARPEVGSDGNVEFSGLPGEGLPAAKKPAVCPGR